jgi:tetratricopeptide (TPR) repeat protein
MSLTPGSAAGLLREARDLNETRAYPDLAELLSPWDQVELGIEPELLFLRADVARRLGNPTEAMSDLEALERCIRRYGNVPLHRRRLNLLGSLQFEAGRIDDARDSWLIQLGEATAAHDEELAARACNNLGVVATLVDDLPAALAYYARAVSAYLQVGYARGLGQAHHNMGITYREMGFLPEADTHFRTADRFARRASSPDEAARVAQERALLVFLMGDAPLARHMAVGALEAYRELGDPVGSAEVHRVSGLIGLGEGDWAAAEADLATALSTAREVSAPLLEAEVLAARSALRELQERRDEARLDREGAAEGFERIGAAAWGRRALDRARSIAARGGARPRPST